MLQGDQATEAVTNDDRALEGELRAHPGYVVSENLHGVALFRSITRSVAPKIHRKHTVTFGEMRYLVDPKAPVTGQAVHEYERPTPVPSLLVPEPHAVTNEPGHIHSLNQAPTRVTPSPARVNPAAL